MSRAGSYCISTPSKFNHLFGMALTVVQLINNVQELADDAMSVRGKLGLYG